jgi:hypothetical protein
MKMKTIKRLCDEVKMTFSDMMCSLVKKKQTQEYEVDRTYTGGCVSIRPICRPIPMEKHYVSQSTPTTPTINPVGAETIYETPNMTILYDVARQKYKIESKAYKPNEKNQFDVI